MRSYRRPNACTRRRHGGNAAAATSVLEILDVWRNVLYNASNAGVRKSALCARTHRR
jgi:hypothetical protein